MIRSWDVGKIVLVRQLTLPSLSHVPGLQRSGSIAGVIAAGAAGAIVGLGTAAVGALGSILLDHFAHGVTHTVRTVVMITLLIAAALVLHHAAYQVELTMRQQVRATEERPPQPPHDFDARST